jgi:hypothetical protein
VKLLSDCGRFKVTRATAPRVSYSTFGSVMRVSWLC